MGAGGPRFNPPRGWENLLVRVLPRGSVGRSILGDLREEHGFRAAKDPAGADRWYRREASGLVVRALWNRVLGRWSTEPRFSPRSGRGTSGDPRGVRLMKTLKLAIRSLLRAPRFTLVAVFTLALGIGANAAIFALVNGVLLQPLDFPESEALVNIGGSAPGMDLQNFPLSAHYYFIYREESSAFADMGFHQDMSANLTGTGDPEDVEARSVSHTLFSTLGVSPLLGRAFSPEEDLPGASPVVVLSHGLWERRSGGDPSVLGQTLQINGEAHEIVGVMRPGFDFPDHVEMWVPARLDPARPPWSFSYRTVGRLGEGVSIEQARAQLLPVVHRIRDDYPEGTSWRSLMDEGRYAPRVTGMKDDLVGSLEEPLWILLATVGFVLLIASTNVANLVLVRAEDRQRESAVRAAMGATRGRLAGQSLTESALLAVLGGAVGMALAWLAIPVVLAQAPPQLPRMDEVSVNGSVLLFTLGVTGLSALFFGMAPLFRLSSPALLSSLKQGGERSTAGPRHQRTKDLLVALQAALALVLMVGSGLMVRSFWSVYQSNLGFDYEDLLTFHISLPQSRYATPEEITAFHEETLEKLRGLPGVTNVAVTSAMPISDPVSSSDFAVEGQPQGQGEPAIMLGRTRVSQGYAETLGIPILAGETLVAADAHDNSLRVMVNEALAHRFWPGENPIGKQLRYPVGNQDGQWFSVAGVLGTVMDGGIRREAQATVYFPLMNPSETVGWSVPSATYVVRGSPLEALSRPVHEAVWSVDPELPLAGISTGEQIVADSIVQLSFTMVTLGIAAVMALILGAVGLFGVLSYSVSQRQREIAVHMTLGAEQGKIMRRVVGDGVRITTLGIVAGLGGAWGLSRFLQGILFGVEAVDPLTYGGMAAALMMVAVLAAYLPARRAASVDPAESMRAE